MTGLLLLSPWLALHAPSRDVDAPTEVPDAPVPKDSSAPPSTSPAPSAPPPVDASLPGPYKDPPAVPEREGYTDGPIPTNAPPGSRRGESREGEVWRPIEPNDYTRLQPPPSESAVAGQGNPELLDSLKKGKPPSLASPQRFALEVKFGPYLPDIDHNYKGEGFGPYARIFGETDARGTAIDQPKKGFYGAIAFEWQIVNLAGPLGIGVQWSMFRDSAQALIAVPPTDKKESVRSEADGTRFAVMPVALQVVYRFELPADRWKIPLVPYAKAGLAYSFWWSKDGNKEISTIKDDAGNVIDRARGGAWGFQLNAGGMLRLDFLERGSARNLDRATGINHTYLFGEYQFSRINNFGRKNSISLGDGTWLLGLAMEF